MRTHETETPECAAKRYLRIGEVVAAVGLSQATIYRKIDSGEFPKPVHLSARRRAWVSAEVQQWMADREAERA